jgi:DNA-binding response OmpR family regulator
VGHVLVIEADRAVRQLLRGHLELAGFAVQDAGDGEDGLRHLRTTPFDIVILDLLLPRVDGLALCRTARAQGPNTNAGIIILSSRMPNGLVT